MHFVLIGEFDYGVGAREITDDNGAWQIVVP